MHMRSSDSTRACLKFYLLCFSPVFTDRLEGSCRIVTIIMDTSDFKLKKKRFKAPSTKEEMEKLAEGFVRKNTKKNTGWACRVFEDWRIERNTQSDSDEKCPEDLLDHPHCAKLNYWLSRFLDELRRKDREPYPARSIHLNLAGIQRKVLEVDHKISNFLIKIRSITVIFSKPMTLRIVNYEMMG